MSVYIKDPQAVLDYGFDWQADGYLASGETISTSTWTAATGLTVQSSSNTTTTTTVWLSGGTHGEDYLITNRIVTNGGRTDERSQLIRCRHR